MALSGTGVGDSSNPSGWSAPLSLDGAYPFTFACWVRLAAGPPNATWCALAHSTGTACIGLLYFGGSIYAEIRDDSNGSAEPNFAWTADTKWHHLAIRVEQNAIQQLYLDGVGQNSSQAAVPTTFTFDRIQAGFAPAAVSDPPFATGCGVAEIVVFQNGLEPDAEIAALAGGANPLTVLSPTQIVSYHPLRGDLLAYHQGQRIGFTPVSAQAGSPGDPIWTDHPPVALVSPDRSYLFPSGATGKTVYVSTTGSDSTGNGTEASPYATIRYASFYVGPGDTVLVEPGDYVGGFSTSVSGAPGSPLTYKSQVKWGARITVPANNSASIAWTNGGGGTDGTVGEYVTIDGFHVDGTTFTTGSQFHLGIYCTGTGNVIQNCKVHDLTIPAGDSGAGLEIDGYNGGTNGDLHDNIVYNVTGTASLVHGIYLSCSGCVCYNNLVVNDDITSWHGATGLQIYNNTCVNGIGILVGSGDVTDSNSAGGHYQTNGCDYCNVFNNVVYKSTQYGIEEEQDTTTGGSIGTHNLYANNILFDCTSGATLMIHGSPTGTITTDPSFILNTGDENGIYYLSSGSPGINAGVQLLGGTAMPVFDLDGNNRNGKTDIGTYAYEPFVSVAGVSATGAVGALSIAASASASASIAGISAAGGVGGITAQDEASVIGVSASGVVGSFIPNILVQLSSSNPWSSDFSADFGPVSVGITGSVGNLSAEISSNLEPVSATGVIGAFSETGSKQSSVPGISAAGAIGTFSSSGGASVVGIHATAVVGFLSPSISEQAVLAGVFAMGMVGSLAASVSQQTSLAGISITSHIESLGTSISHQIALPGVVAATGIGLFTAEDRSSLVGQFVAGSVASLLAGIGYSVQLSGLAAAASVGSLALGSGVVLSGVSATGSVDNFTFGSGYAVQLSGVFAAASVGQLSPEPGVGLREISAIGAVGPLAGVGVGVGLSGVTATGNIGSIALSTGHGFQLLGVSATGVVGTFSPETDYQISGVAAAGAVGALSVGVGYASQLVGQAATGAVGALSYGSDRNADTIGVSATAVVGSFEPFLQLAALPGQAISTALEPFQTLAGKTTSVVGVAAAGAIGSLRYELDFGVSGIASAAHISLLAPSSPIGLHGVYTIADLGALLSSIGPSLAGLSSQTEIGGFVLHADYDLQGILAYGDVGLLALTKEPGLNGIAATTAVGEFGRSRSSQVAVPGVSATGVLGTLATFIGAVEGVSASVVPGQVYILAVDGRPRAVPMTRWNYVLPWTGDLPDDKVASLDWGNYPLPWF